MNAAVIILMTLVVLIPLGIALLLIRVQGGTIAALREEKNALQEDNRRLTEGICRAHGDYMDLRPQQKTLLSELEASVEADMRRGQPPYWDSKKT